MIEEISPFFRTTLHLICERQLASKENLPGLTVFLGELYSQLHYENLYGKSLLCAMNSLLAIGDDASVKCVCQVLKVKIIQFSNIAGLTIVRISLQVIS